MSESRSNLINGLAQHIGAPPLLCSRDESILALAVVAAHGTGGRTAASLAADEAS